MWQRLWAGWNDPFDSLNVRPRAIHVAWTIILVVALGFVGWSWAHQSDTSNAWEQQHCRNVTTPYESTVECEP